jgi:hypothetical protein
VQLTGATIGDSDFELSGATISNANPGGVPQAVAMPGGTPFTISGATLANAVSTPTTSTASGTSSPVASLQLGVSTSPAADASAVSSAATSWVGQTVVIALGIIFIAAGLFMLRSGVTIKEVVKRHV